MRETELPRVLTSAAAAVLGVTTSYTRTQLRHGRWRRVASGVVLTRPDEPTRADWAEAGLWLGGPRAALTGWDALRLRRIGPAQPLHPLVVVLVPGGHNRIVGGVHLRPTRRPYSGWTTSIEDPTLPLVSVVPVPRAVADTALACRSLSTVRALVAGAIQRQACTLEQLATEVGTCPRNGSAHLRTAVADVVAGARSAAEASAADRLRRARLPEFEMNVPLLSANGRVLAVLDFLWRGLLAVLEIDSREFHFREADWKATGARHNLLTRFGLAVTHYPPSATSTPSWTDEVEAWLRNRAAELRTPYSAATLPADGSPLRLPLVRQHLPQRPALA